MINKTYLILAHKNAIQLSRLIDRINDENSFFYIHIDKKTEIQLFLDLIKINNVVFIENRENCIWGDYSIVKATFTLIKHAIESNRSGFIILLSGQDYPLKKQIEIDSFLSKHIDFNFIDTIPVEKLWIKNYKLRTESYKFNISNDRYKSKSFSRINKPALKSLFRKEISFSQLLLLTTKRKFKLGLNQFGGSQWWALNHYTLIKMYEFIQANIKLLNEYYQYTLCPDEIFFQTIIKHLSEQDKLIKIKPSITYVNWTRKIYDPSPLTFTIEDKDELLLLGHDKLFARKFDMFIDEQILDALDAFLDY